MNLFLLAMLTFPLTQSPPVPPPTFQHPSWFYTYFYDWGDYGPNVDWENRDDGGRDWTITHTFDVSRKNSERYAIHRIPAAQQLKGMPSTRRTPDGWVTHFSTRPMEITHD